MNNRYQNKNRPVERAIILAAGRGRRLRPYTDYTPKPLLKVNGKPTLGTILTALAHVAVSDVCLVTHYLAEQIEAFVGDGSEWGLRTTFRRQNTMQGTAHAVQTAADFITGPCFILAADYILPPNYLYELHQTYAQHPTSLAVSLKELSAGDARHRSSVRFDKNGRIREIVEKPAPGTAPSQIGASLIYIVPPEIRLYLDDLHLSERGEYELPGVINRMLRDGYGIAGCVQPAPGEWDVGMDGSVIGH